MSFDELYQRFNRLVFNLALQYTQNREDAEEITQDVFMSVHASLTRFRGDSTAETWIYRITINKSLDFVRSAQRKKRLSSILSIFAPGVRAGESAPHFDHPGVLLERKEMLQSIFHAINSLPGKQRTVLILHKIEQKSQAEIAAIMRLSPKAVESLMQRAKAGLRKKLHTTKDYEQNIV